MKKYRLMILITLMLMFLMAPFADAASSTVYKKLALTTGCATCLDGIDGAGLLANDMAFTTASNVVYIHILDASNNSAESSPAIISPDTNPGVKRWILQNVYIGAATGTSVAVTGDVSGATVRGYTINQNVSTDASPTFSGLYLNSYAAGTWTTPVFNASSFSASGAMTWTVEAADVTTYEYTIVNKMMTVNFYIDNTTVGGTPAANLYIKIPASKVSTKSMMFTYIANVVGTMGITRGSIGVSGTSIALDSNAAEANWTAGSNNTGVYGSVTFEIN